MKHTKYLAGLLILSMTNIACAEKVYVCPLKNGKSEYTSAYRPGCTDAKLKKIESYTPEEYTSTMPQAADNGSSEPTSAPPAATQNSAAAAELAAAERALAEGQEIRLGNERNYAKKQERIQKLEEDVAHSREKLQNSQNNDAR